MSDRNKITSLMISRKAHYLKSADRMDEQIEVRRHYITLIKC